MSSRFEYFRPKTRTEAIELLACTDSKFVPLLTHPRPDALGSINADAFVDLGSLDLDYISLDEGNIIHIGSTTSLESILSNSCLQIQTKGLINKASSLVAPQSIRNLSTLWGAIQTHSGPPEFVLALLGLDAEIHLQNADHMQYSIDFPKYFETKCNSIKESELVLEARFASLPDIGCGWALERVTRTPMDEAIVAALAILEINHGHTHRLRLALAGANQKPSRIEPVERMLQGQLLTPEIISRAARTATDGCSPKGDFRGSAEYRQAMAEVVIRRAVQKAWDQAIHSTTG
jgi:CO/xanthine dehydrogenase FAD-binding subunit